MDGWMDGCCDLYIMSSQKKVLQVLDKRCGLLEFLIFARLLIKPVANRGCYNVAWCYC